MDDFTFYFQDVYGIDDEPSLIIDFQHDKQLYKCMLSGNDIRNTTNNVVNSINHFKEVIIKAKENRDGWTMRLIKEKDINMMLFYRNESFILLFDLKFTKVSMSGKWIKISIFIIVLAFIGLIFYFKI